MMTVVFVKAWMIIEDDEVKMFLKGNPLEAKTATKN